MHAASDLSPYTHFGQIAPQRAALLVKEHYSKHGEGVKSYLEESVVRRELSDNFCFYEPNYDNLQGAAGWAAAMMPRPVTARAQAATPRTQAATPCAQVGARLSRAPLDGSARARLQPRAARDLADARGHLECRADAARADGQDARLHAHVLGQEGAAIGSRATVCGSPSLLGNTFTHLHTPSHPLTHPYTPLHTLTHPYTPSHTLTHPYTPLGARVVAGRC